MSPLEKAEALAVGLGITLSYIHRLSAHFNDEPAQIDFTPSAVMEGRTGEAIELQNAAHAAIGAVAAVAEKEARELETALLCVRQGGEE